MSISLRNNFKQIGFIFYFGHCFVTRNLVTNGNNSIESTHVEDSPDADEETNDEIVPESDVPEIELIIKVSIYHSFAINLKN